MKNTWFTSDHHFGHKAIIKYCNRPFSSVEEMDDVLIQKWNSTVKRNDIVYYLGDFTLGGIEQFIKYKNRLNGDIYFIRGNHDKWYTSRGNNFLGELATISVQFSQNKKGIPIVMCHYAMRSWYKSHYGSIHMFGHHHGNLPSFGISFDVGVDTNDFLPYELEDVRDMVKLLLTTQNDYDIIGGYEIVYSQL